MHMRLPSLRVCRYIAERRTIPNICIGLAAAATAPMVNNRDCAIIEHAFVIDSKGEPSWGRARSRYVWSRPSSSAAPTASTPRGASNGTTAPSTRSTASSPTAPVRGRSAGTGGPSPGTWSSGTVRAATSAITKTAGMSFTTQTMTPQRQAHRKNSQNAHSKPNAQVNGLTQSRIRPQKDLLGYPLGVPVFRHLKSPLVASFFRLLSKK